MKFGEYVASNLPSISMAAESGFFILPPTEHILCGFAYDKTPNGGYVWKVILPISDRIGFLGLSFSERLTDPGDFIENNLSVMKRAEKFCNIIAPRIVGVEKFKSAKYFLAETPVFYATASHIAARSYATILILEGELEKAKFYLGEALSICTESRHKEFISDTKMLFELCNENLEGAIKLVLKWELETKRKFNIISLQGAGL